MNQVLATPSSPQAPQTKLRSMPPPSRPAFSTLQQHYSPAKSALPKPPVPPAKATSTLPAHPDTAITFETAKQQAELLHLSLLHQASDTAQQQYTASARRKLRARHTALTRTFVEIQAAEHENQKLSNLAALAAWSHSPADLAEDLQTLGRMFRELAALSEPDSRYSELVTTFETWMHRAQHLLRRERRGTETDFLEPLPESWKHASVSISLRLRALQRELSLLPPPPTDQAKRSSSLGTLLRCCSNLSDGMAAELDVMTKLEREVLAREKRGIEEDIVRMNGIEQIDRWMPAWQQQAA